MPSAQNDCLAVSVAWVAPRLGSGATNHHWKPYCPSGVALVTEPRALLQVVDWVIQSAGNWSSPVGSLPPLATNRPNRPQSLKVALKPWPPMSTLPGDSDSQTPSLC